MPVTPSGTLAGPLGALRTMLGSSTNFRTWTGTASQVAAEARVHLIDQPAASVTRPYAILGWAEWRTRRAGYAGGVLRLAFECAPSAPDLGDSDAALELLNAVGPIVQDLHELAEDGTAAPLLLNESTIEWGPHRAKNEAEDYLSIAFLVRYGLVNLP